MRESRRRYDPLVPLAARIAFGLAGLVVAVYAWASLTGHVTPPWFDRDATDEEWRDRVDHFRTGFFHGPPGWTDRGRVAGKPPATLVVGLGAVGLAAVAFAAWP